MNEQGQKNLWNVFRISNVNHLPKNPKSPAGIGYRKSFGISARPQCGWTPCILVTQLIYPNYNVLEVSLVLRHYLPLDRSQARFITWTVIAHTSVKYLGSSWIQFNLDQRRSLLVGTFDLSPEFFNKAQKEYEFQFLRCIKFLFRARRIVVTRIICFGEFCGGFSSGLLWMNEI